LGGAHDLAVDLEDDVASATQDIRDLASQPMNVTDTMKNTGL